MGVLRSEPRNRLTVIDKALTPLQVGEVWYAKLPGNTHLEKVTVEEITERTVVLDHDAGYRYARTDVEFVERARANVD
jgi:hypothetical protein